jgi:hypothetical protein
LTGYIVLLTTKTGDYIQYSYLPWFNTLPSRSAVCRDPFRSHGNLHRECPVAKVRYTFFPSMAGTDSVLVTSWPGENVSGQTKRAVAVAMQITIGDIGAIAG